MKQYRADVFVNGEWRYGHVGGSKKGAIASAKHHAAWMAKDEATIAQTLKIRDRTVVEVKVNGRKIRS